jgi:hypothetical protein
MFSCAQQYCLSATYGIMYGTLLHCILCMSSCLVRLFGQASDIFMK